MRTQYGRAALELMGFVFDGQLESGRYIVTAPNRQRLTPTMDDVSNETFTLKQAVVFANLYANAFPDRILALVETENMAERQLLDQLLRMLAELRSGFKRAA